jgi:hypothetical protein
MICTRFGVQAVNWRKHLLETVKSDPTYGCFARVERQEYDDGILVHRAAIRYWTIKASDANFHSVGIGGARHTCFQDFELDIVKNYVLYFFKKDNFGTQAELADELSQVFNRVVSVRV